MKTLYYFIIILILTPNILFSQKVYDSLKTRTIDEIYFIIKTVIDKEKLDKNCGLAMTPEENYNIDIVDSIYLKLF